MLLSLYEPGGSSDSRASTPASADGTGTPLSSPSPPQRVKLSLADHPRGLTQTLALVLDSAAMRVMFRGVITQLTLSTVMVVADVVDRIAEHARWSGVVPLVKTGVLGQLSNLGVVLTDFLLNKSALLEAESVSGGDDTKGVSNTADASLANHSTANAGATTTGSSAMVSKELVSHAVKRLSVVIGMCSIETNTGRSWLITTPKRSKVRAEFKAIRAIVYSFLFFCCCFLFFNATQGLIKIGFHHTHT